MRCTGEGRSHPTKLVVTKQNWAHKWRSAGGQGLQKPHWVHRIQLGAAVLYSDTVSGTCTTLASPDHFLLDSCCCSISKAGRWCRTISWAKTWIHMHWFPSGNFKLRTTLCHTSAFLCVLCVSPLKCTETLVWTELQSPQRGGHPKAPHTNSGRNCWGYEDPSNTLFFLHKWQWQFLRRRTSLWPESTKGVCSETTDLESKAESVLGLSTAAISLFPTLLSKVPQHTSRRSKSVKYNINTTTTKR